MIPAFLVLSHNSHTIIIELFLSCGFAWLVLVAVSLHLDFVPTSAIDQNVQHVREDVEI
jgi:hypothetical protein